MIRLNRITARTLKDVERKSFRHVPSVLATLILLTQPTGCFRESKVDPAQPSTFARSYNNGYDTFAVQLEQTPDGGYIILANSNVRDSEADPFEFKIVLVKTDRYGNELWMRHYPEITDKSRDLVGTSITLLSDGGYLVTGSEIEERNASTGEIIRFKPFIMTVDNNNTDNGTVTKEQTYSGVNNARVVAATVKETNSGYDFLVLSTSVQQDTSFMILSAVPSSTLQITSSQRYFVSDASGTADLTPVNKLFFESGSLEYTYFGGTSSKSNRNQAIFAKAQPSRKTTEFANEFGYPSFDETINDICQLGNGFAMIGKTNFRNNDDILFIKVSSSGIFSDSSVFVSEILSDEDYNSNTKREDFKELNSKNEVGNSISSTSDGGFIVLSTIDSYGAPIPLGAGNTDMSLLKINGFGDRLWARSFGGSDAESGNCVRQASDGGYAVLGTSRLGNRRTIMFLKTDKNGEID